MWDFFIAKKAEVSFVFCYIFSNFVAKYIIMLTEKTMEKLRILAESAKYDVSCSSSGTVRKGKQGMVGSTVGGVGICHSFADEPTMPCWPLRTVPLDEHDTSYFADSARIRSFSIVFSVSIFWGLCYLATKIVLFSDSTKGFQSKRWHQNKPLSANT